MCKTKGAKNYFKGGEFYYLKDAVPYCNNNGVTVPESWKKEKLHRLAREWGIIPAYDNGVEGPGHHEKYSSSQMYWFCKNLIGILKKEKEVLPLEKMAKEAKRRPKKVESPVLEEDDVPAPLDDNFIEIANAYIALGEAMKKALGVL